MRDRKGKFVIEPYAEKHFDGVWALFTPPGPSLADFQLRGIIEDVKKRSNPLLLVARQPGAEGKVIGFAAGHKMGPTYTLPESTRKQVQEPAYVLELLAVHPDFRQQGIGEKLTRAREQAALRAGCKSIISLTEEGFGPRVQMHSKLGYKKVAPSSREWMLITAENYPRLYQSSRLRKSRIEA